MDPVTLSKQNRLFWLGRYAERVYVSVQLMMKEYDALIDGTPMDYADFCRRMGIPNSYHDSEDFFRRYLFDENEPSSVRSAMSAMLGNGMMLRETISSPTLAYLQMAKSALDLASYSDAPAVEMQWILDDIMAFRGSFDESVEREDARNITKVGGMVELISLMLRLDWQKDRLKNEIQKLLNRMYKTDLPTQPQATQQLIRYALEDTDVSDAELLHSVEVLFCI